MPPPPPDEPPRFTIEDGQPVQHPPEPRKEYAPRDRGERKKSSAIWIVLIANAIPVACVIAWFAMPEDKRQKIRDAIPAGVGGRALIAGIAFVVLILLARLVLPAARTAGLGLAAALAWFRRQPKGKRIALYVPEFFVYLGWVAMQILFALDAVAIVGTAVAFLLYVARIVKPELFPWLPPHD